MARKKDLGGLAALAGLAYLASRDKAAKGDVPSGDDQYNPDVKQRGPDLGAIYAEDGSLSKLRRNTETGDLYSPDEAVTRPAAASRSMGRPASKGVSTAGNAGYDTIQPLGGRDNARDALIARQGRTPGGLQNARDSVLARQDRRKMNPENTDELSDMTYRKKGGSVKGWGSARGARKAKIY